MKTKLVLTIFISVLFLSCKNENSKTVEASNQKQADYDKFKVELSIISPKEDNICLLYTEDGSIDFAKGGTIFQNLIASDVPQTVIYTFPADIYPTQLRLDFGLKKIQEKFEVKSIKLEYKDKTRIITGPEMGIIFRADDSKCSFDATTGTLKALMKDGSFESPSLYPQETNLGPEILKLAN